MRKMRWIVLSLAVVALLFGMAGRGEAAPIPITVLNSGFEFPVQPDGGFTTPANGAFPWQHPASDAVGVWNPSATQAYGGMAPEGSNVAFASGAAFSQTLTAVLLANTTYSLDVLVGNRQGAAFPGFQVQLWANSTLLSQCVTCVMPLDGQFLNANVTFTTGTSHSALGQALKIVLASNANGQTNFDNVRLSANTVINGVPEPASLLLLGSGLTGLGLC